LCLAVVENRHAVRVLQIVGGADFVFGVAAAIRPPSREPRAALAAPPVAERKTLFEAAPIGFGADPEPQPSGAGFEVCIADRPCHISHLDFWGAFGEYLWTNGSVPRRTRMATNDGRIHVHYCP